MENTTHGPLPLVVGVTGHVDLQPDAHEAVAASVRNLLESLVNCFGNSEIWVMTALAEGADQLVAEAAQALHLPLVAVLPMPLDDYERTLQTDAGRKRLHTLWSEAALRMELPWIDDGKKPNRNELQYEQVGLVITHFSHVMVALWNGNGEWQPEAKGDERSDRRGGTAHIVYLRAVGEYESPVYQRSQIFPHVRTTLYPVESGLTFRIATPRESAQGCVGVAGSLWLRTGRSSEVAIDADRTEAELREGSRTSELHPMEEEARHTLNATRGELARLNKANGLLAEIAQTRGQRIARSAERLLPPDAMRTLGGQRLPATAIRDAHAMADAFSQKNRVLIFLALDALILVLLASVLTFEQFVHHDEKRMLFYYFIVNFFAWLAYRTLIRPGQWQNHFQDYRALAEALRVQFFWGLSGIRCGVQDFYMRKHQDELSWIRTALRGTALHALAMGLGPVQREVVTRYWIESQFDYFSGAGRPAGTLGKAEYNRRKWVVLEWLAWFFYLVGIVMAALMALLLLFAKPAAPDDTFHSLLVTAIGFAPALAGALTIFSEKRAFKDHAHQYSRMGRLFGKALALVTQLDVGKEEEFKAIVGDLGAEALAENGDWLISHRDRRVEPIKGG
jgi:hypothetical protein